MPFASSGTLAHVLLRWHTALSNLVALLKKFLQEEKVVKAKEPEPVDDLATSFAVFEPFALRLWKSKQSRMMMTLGPCRRLARKLSQELCWHLLCGWMTKLGMQKASLSLSLSRSFEHPIKHATVAWEGIDVD